jgi:hypothetical protein
MTNPKVKCNCCNRLVSKNYIAKHKTTKRCLAIKSIMMIEDNNERKKLLLLQKQTKNDRINCDKCNSIVVKKYLSVHKTKQKCFRKTYIRNLLNDRYESYISLDTIHYIV